MSKSQPNSTVIRLFSSLCLLPALLPSHSDICSSPQAPLQGHVICVLHRFHQDFQLCLESSPMGTEPDFQFQVLSHQGMVQGPETRLVHQTKVFRLCHQPKPFFFPQVLQFLVVMWQFVGRVGHVVSFQREGNSDFMATSQMPSQHPRTILSWKGTRVLPAADFAEAPRSLQSSKHLGLPELKMSKSACSGWQFQQGRSVPTFSQNLGNYTDLWRSVQRIITSLVPSGNSVKGRASSLFAWMIMLQPHFPMPVYLQNSLLMFVCWHVCVLRIFHMMVALTPLLLQKVKMATGLAVEMAAVSWFPKVRCEPERPSGVQYSRHFRIAPSQSKAQQLLDEDIVALLRWPMSGVLCGLIALCLCTFWFHPLDPTCGKDMQRCILMHSLHSNGIDGISVMPTISCQQLHLGISWPCPALSNAFTIFTPPCRTASTSKLGHSDLASPWRLSSVRGFLEFNGIQSAHPKFPTNSLRASKLVVSAVLSSYQQSWCWVPQLHLIPRTANRSREAKRIQKMHPSIFRTNHNTRVDLHQDLLSHKRSENLNYRILYHVEVATD